MNSPVAPCLVILGMHRSGTSLIASWLHGCGLPIGQRLLGANTGNEKGHFEDLDFLDLHRSILANHHMDPDGLIPVEAVDPLPQELEQMRRLVHQRQHLNGAWGWKEPRSCLFLRPYAALLPEARYLVVFRHYALVVDSLVRRKIKIKERRVHKKNPVLRFFHKLVFLPLWKTKIAGVSDHYLAAWILYNEEILAMLHGMNKENYRILDAADILARESELSTWLHAHGLIKKHIDLRSIMDESLLSTNPVYTATHTKLLQRADAVLSRLRTLAQS